MTRLALVAGVCSLTVAASVGAASGSDTGRLASLHALDMQPLVVRGSGFEPSERVRLMLSSGAGQRWRTTEAGSAGRFTMGFDISVGACGRFMVQAFGSRGSRARLMPRRAQIDCVSPDRGTPTTTHGDSTK
jgi:hypothetical protein